ncbi:MAG: bifunctional SulP family inorganic anion transporter/carbonic anhydrase [Oleispira sp.]|nr:bifunctional SulP family inorganic anion transporter/carbonic anhydrase [Oleispira sp.]MBL4880616.1 bifunctional SulP family inorganic anion transporter/carbonic anhydrase [Oleispira sp.]
MAEHPNYLKTLPQDLKAGLVVFLVALPLCLGVAMASGVPMISGIVAGVVGGIIVAWLSGSHTSISGPAAGLTAIIAAQVAILGSVEALLVAVILAGMLQMALGALKAGSLAVFIPSSVIKGLLAAIGIILILKQIPFLVGYNPDWFGDMTFNTVGGENTFSELFLSASNIHPGATFIGIISLLILLFWDKTPMKKLSIPVPLVVVIVGVILVQAMPQLGLLWGIMADDMVQVPSTGSIMERIASIPSPDVSVLSDPKVYIAAITIAIVASLETLLNLEAVDKLDPKKRVSPPNRELFAQGVGNMTSGLIGGLPITSVVVRSSVGISAGGQTRMTTFIHGVLLLVSVLFLPQVLNLIPLSALAAILIFTGFKLAAPKVFKDMWAEGKVQFLPFIMTIVAIVLTDLLIGIIIGMAVATAFILYNNLQSPLRKIKERHVGGEVLRIELASQLTFMNRAALLDTLNEIEAGTQLVLDARETDYMDSDIIALIHEFEQETAPAHKIKVSLLGFKDHYDKDDHISYIDVTTREIQNKAKPSDVLEMLKEGNKRFVSGEPIIRDSRRQIDNTAEGQFPQAMVLTCMDSRVATEMMFDVGLGDLFSLRVAGNVAAEQELGSMEYGCGIAGAKLILVLGHTGCGAVAATVDLVAKGDDKADAGEGFNNLSVITNKIAHCVHEETQTQGDDRHAKNTDFVKRITEINVQQTMKDVYQKSSVLRNLIDQEKVLLVGGIYNVKTGEVEFLNS